MPTNTLRIFYATLILVVLVLVALVKGQMREEFVERIYVEEQEVIDLRHIQFFELQTSKGTLLLSGERALPLIKFLTEHKNQKLILSVEKP